MLSEVINVRNAWGGLLCPFLFALSGVLGAVLFQATTRAESNWVYIVPAAPFGIACASLCLRRSLLAVAAAAIYCFVWAAALYVATYLCGHNVNQYLAMIPAGFVGGVGVAGLTSLDALRLRTLPALAASGALGAVFALPFAFYVKPFETLPLSEDMVLRLSFALWQAAVGMYVYRMGDVARVTSAAA